MARTKKDRWQEIIDASDLIVTRLELCRLYLRDYPDSGPAWRAYGTGLFDVSLFDEAEIALKRALELAPEAKRFYALADLGRVYQRQGDSVLAERFYRDAIAADPDNTHGYIYLGALMARDGRLDEAEAIHRRGTQCLRGCVDEAYLNLGFILRARGRYKEATASFREAVRLDPNYEIAKAAMKDCNRAMRIVKNQTK